MQQAVAEQQRSGHSPSFQSKPSTTEHCTASRALLRTWHQPAELARRGVAAQAGEAARGGSAGGQRAPAGPGGTTVVQRQLPLIWKFRVCKRLCPQQHGIGHLQERIEAEVRWVLVFAAQQNRGEGGQSRGGGGRAMQQGPECNAPRGRRRGHIPVAQPSLAPPETPLPALASTCCRWKQEGEGEQGGQQVRGASAARAAQPGRPTQQPPEV